MLHQRTKYLKDVIKEVPLSTESYFRSAYTTKDQVDVKFTFSVDLTCWCYSPRTIKPLSYHSVHSKLVKREIAKMCFTNVLNKSCHHCTDEAFRQQARHLHDAGYPSQVLV